MTTIRIDERTRLTLETIKRVNKLSTLNIVSNATNVYSKLVAADSQGAEIIIKWPSKENTRILLP